MPSKDLTKGVPIFLGEQEYEIRPLTIRQLRKFMSVITGLNTENAELTDEDINKMVEAAQIALSKAAPELSADPEALEDILDIRTFNEVLSAAMGADPEG